MRKLKYVKLFEGFQVNEGIFDIFKSKERIESEKAEKPSQDLLKNLMNPDKFDIVKVKSPEYKSFNDIKEGDYFLSSNCVELLEMGKKDLAFKKWHVIQVESINDYPGDQITYKYVYLDGEPSIFTVDDERFYQVDKDLAYLYFEYKIVMK